MFGIDKDFYRRPSEEDEQKDLEKKRETLGELKWKQVQFKYVQSRMKDKFTLCSKRTGQHAKYALMKKCDQPWNPIASVAMSSWEMAKKDGYEYFRLLRAGNVATNEFSIKI